MRDRDVVFMISSDVICMLRLSGYSSQPEVDALFPEKQSVFFPALKVTLPLLSQTLNKQDNVDERMQMNIPFSRRRTIHFELDSSLLSRDTAA